MTVAALLAGGCGSPEAAATPAPKTTPAPQVTEKDSWQTRWEKVKTGASKDGTVVIASSAGAPVKSALSAATKEKFGVTTEFVSGRPAEFVPKVLAERRAGLYLEDIFLGGGTTVLGGLGPGILEKLDDVIFLPEVLDPKAWFSGSIPWVDSGHYSFTFTAYPGPPITVNSNMVKPGEIKSYRDLLDPKWKGKIVLSDPTVAGGANSWFYAVADGIMDLDYLRKLADQEPVVMRDERLIMEWIAKGRYPVALAVKGEEQATFLEAGAPIDVISPTEGSHLSAGIGHLFLLKNAPHPDASTLFINWILTKDGGTVFARAMGAQSARVDVPTDFLHPAFVRQPGVKYFPTIYEKDYLKKDEYLPISKEILGRLIK